MSGECDLCGEHCLDCGCDMKKKKVFAPKEMGLQPGTRIFEWGECKVLLSPPTERTGYHMSISHESRYPTWDEVRDAWYALVPNSNNRVGAMILPQKKDYINIHPHCFQVHEIL